MLTLVFRDASDALQVHHPAAADLPALLSAKKAEGFFWLDLEAPTPDEAELLSSYFQFHRLEIEDALEEVHHPKLEEDKDHLFVILHAAPSLEDGEADASTELDIFIGAGWLVTHHASAMPAIQQTLKSCPHHEIYFGRSPGYLAYTIIDHLMEGYDPLLDALEGEIGALEDEVFRDPTPAVLQQLFAIKRSVMELRRIVVYQRDVLSRLSRITNNQIGPELAIYYRDVWDHLSRVLDQAEQLRDELVGVMDAYLSQVSNRLNEIMKFLTAISTLFIPLNFITGFFGMNFEFMPLLHSEWGFGLMVAVMLLVAWGSREYFRRRGWL